MRCDDVPQPSTIAQHVVPGNGSAALFWPFLKREVGDEPGRIREPWRAHSFDDIRRDETRGGEDHLLAYNLVIPRTYAPSLSIWNDPIRWCSGHQICCQLL